MNSVENGRLSGAWTTAAEIIIFLFALVGCLEKIHDLYYMVMVLDGVAAVISFFFIVLWFFRQRGMHRDGASSALAVLTLTVLVSSIVRSSDVPRLLVALYALIESWALAIAVMILGRRTKAVAGGVWTFVIFFAVLYSSLSLILGIEKGEVRFSGLSDQTNSLAVVAASAALICLSLIGRRRNIILSVGTNIALVLSIALYAYTLTKTDSRTSFFALVIALAFFLVLQFLFSSDRFSLLLSVVIALLMIAAVVVFLLSSSRSEGRLTLSSLTSGRTTIWSETLSRMEAEDYLFGFGGNSSEMTRILEERGMDERLAEYLGEDHLMHNIYIQFLVEYGIVSAGAFIFLSLFLFVKALQTMRRRASSRSLLIPSLTLLLFFLVHSLAESSIYFIGGTEQFLFIFSSAVIYSLYRKEEDR
jgi:O-antigen ligase